MLLKIISKLTPIFALTLIGYAGAYLFELGYLHHFDLGMQSVRVTVNSFIVWAFVACMAVPYFTISVWPLLHRYLDPAPNEIKNIQYRKIMAFALLIVLAMLFTGIIFNSFELLYLCAIPVFMGYVVLSPFRYKKKSMTYAQAVDSQTKNKKKIPKKERNIYLDFIERTSVVAILIGVAVVALGSLFAAGKSNLKTFEYDKKEYGVISEYDDLIIAREIKANKITGSTIYRKISEQPIVFETTEITKPHKSLTVQLAGNELFTLVEAK